MTLTLVAHAQQGLLGLSVRPSVTTFSATTRNKQGRQRVQRYTGFIFEMAIFVKVLRSEVLWLETK